jgi:hypothetical protein
MGADYYAKAVIGVRLPDEDQFPRAKKMVRKKAFKHDYGDGDAEFHPKTGQKLFLDEKEEVEEDFPAFVFADKYGDVRRNDENQQVIKIPQGLEVVYGTDGNNTCLGFALKTGSSNGGDDYGFMQIPDIDDIKNKIKSLLEPLGLWDEKDFGIHLILYCSY